jgi:tripartite-type tricarboxylate transporter receptor subunit TctC
MKRLIVPLLAALLAALPLPAFAQAWPTKVVKVIVPYPPGGAVDVVARRVAQKLQEQTGQPFVVENRPGAAGSIGCMQAARSPADGYTLVANDMSYSLMPHVFKQLPWDHDKDLVAITSTMFTPYALAVRADGPYKTLADLVAAAKAKPDTIMFGSGGPGTAPHFAAEQFQITAKISLMHVPYKGAAEAMTGLISGQVDLLLASPASLLSQAKAGRARILAISGERRQPALPDVPTFAEAGLREFGIMNFNGLWAPKGTPPEVLARIQSETAKAVASADVRAFFESQVGQPGGTPTEEFAAQVRETTRRWGEVAAVAKVEKQ